MDFEGTDNAVLESPAEEPTSLDTAPAPEAEGGELHSSDTNDQGQEPEAGEGEPAPVDEDDFEWDGEKYRLPKKLVEGLRDGTLMRADYTRKTQEVAETAQSLALAEARLVQQAQAMKAGAEGYGRLEAANKTLADLNQALDKALEDGDSMRATAIQRDLRAWEQHKAAVETWLGNVQQAVVSQSAQFTQRAWEQTNARLSKEIPGWEKGEINQKISGWALQNGFTPDQVRNIVHYPVVKALYKAFLYDQSQSSKKPATPTKPAVEPTRQIAKGQTAPAARGTMADLAKRDDPTEFIRQRRAQRAKE